MIFFVVILSVLSAVAITVFAITSNAKREEKEKYYAAAGSILKEDFLNYSLQNPLMADSCLEEPNGQKMMIYIKSVSSKPKKQYVFDPGKNVMIGRDKENSNIYLNEAFVSQLHCCIYADGLDVYIRDMNSVNGTVVKRGFQSFFLIDGEEMQLQSNDLLVVGSNKFRIIPFYYDMVLM